MTAVPHLELLPAVDIKGGQAVQLVQGVDGSEKRFGDPIEAALRWQDAGAEWLHLVDLDAAFGRGNNRELQAEIVGRLDINVEMSGGIRDDESLEAAMATGCRRVNIGTAALEQPEWCAQAIATFGDQRVQSALPELLPQLTHQYPLVRFYTKAAIERITGQPLPVDVNGSGAEIRAAANSWWAARKSSAAEGARSGPASGSR